MDERNAIESRLAEDTMELDAQRRIRIVARSTARAMRSHGHGPADLIALASELVDLARAGLRETRIKKV